MFSRSEIQHVSSSSVAATQRNSQGKPAASHRSTKHSTFVKLASFSATTMTPSPSESSKVLFASSTTLSSSSDPCISNPCQNGGTCIKEKQGAFTCRCPMMYTLSRCQLFAGTCQSLPRRYDFVDFKFNIRSLRYVIKSRRFVIHHFVLLSTTITSYLV